VIFTLPHDLNALWLTNMPVMSALLLQAVRDTLVDLLADPQYLGAQPGIIAALHTWSQTLVLHPHMHCLVTGGGLTPEGQWRAVRNGFLLPARVVMAVFRGKMLAAIRQALAREALTVPAPRRPLLLLNLLNRLGHPTKTPWNVRIMERYPHGAGVVTYLARYLRGGSIKNARLVAWDGDRVTFTYRTSAQGHGSVAPPRSCISSQVPRAEARGYLLLRITAVSSRGAGLIVRMRGPGLSTGRPRERHEALTPRVERS
jgi:hypothetical protein